MAPYRPKPQYRSGSPARRILVVNGETTRSFTIRPFLMGAAILMGVLVSAGYLGATAYWIFRDDIMNATLARKAEMQQVYEDRIAVLRSEIDKIATRQVLEQVSFDEKVDRLLAAQEAFGNRAKMVSNLIERARARGLLSDEAEGDDHAAAEPEAVGNAYTANDHKADIEGHFAGLMEADKSKSAKATSPAATVMAVDRQGKPDLKAIATGLKALDQEQTQAVRAIAGAAKARAVKVTRLVEDLGLEVKIASGEATAGLPASDAMGGPYIPYGSAEALSSAIAEADAAILTLGEIKKAVAKLPVSMPLKGAAMTSNFGSRTDPFLGSIAFHAGVDFRSPIGRPVKATGDGRVSAAGRAGGYGNMVEIDHGKGLTTRYAHLSKIDVKVGDKVSTGEIIGRVGSTGRSTGPHLHYETRVGGVAVNPVSYIRAGRKIESMLR